MLFKTFYKFVHKTVVAKSNTPIAVMTAGLQWNISAQKCWMHFRKQAAKISDLTKLFVWF